MDFSGFVTSVADLTSQTLEFIAFSAVSESFRFAIPRDVSQGQGLQIVDKKNGNLSKYSAALQQLSSSSICRAEIAESLRP